MRCRLQWITVGISVILFALSTGTVFAAQEADNSSFGVLDIPENLEIEESMLDESFDADSELPDAVTQRLSMGDLRAVKDQETSYFRYNLPNGTWFTSNIPVGAVSTEPITLNFSEELYLFEAKLDGKFLNPSKEPDFAEPGSYDLVLHTGSANEGESMIFYELPIHFQICTPVTNVLSELEVPLGFHVQEVLLNGKQKAISENPMILEEDGTWRLTLVSDADSTAVYHLEFVLDREAPKLWFSKSIDRGAVRAPLEIRGLEEDCEILIKKGSEPISLQNGALTYGGIYQVIARDSVGNERNYRVQIRYRVFQSPVGMVILFALLAAGGLSAYLIYVRRHMQIL